MNTGRLAVDTSAVAAVVFGEPDAEIFATTLMRHAGDCAIAAPTLVEAEIVVEARLGPAGLQLLSAVISRAAADVVAFDEPLVRTAAAGWLRFGKGRHPAGLNLGDCFAYALARHLDAPLLFKGSDFAQTDVRAAI